MKPKPEAKNAPHRKKPQPVVLHRLRDRIYAHLLGCERGEAGPLEGVRHTTLADLARAFDRSEAVMARDVVRLAAAGGAGRLGNLVFPLPGYKMQPIPAKPPRQTTARGNKLRTRNIAGYEVTLAEGVRYSATRPMAPPPNTPVTISIRELPSSIGDIPAFQVTVQNREDADKFLRRFNGRNSFDGRVW